MQKRASEENGRTYERRRNRANYRAIATVLWVVLAGYALWILRQPIAAVVGGLAGVEAFGVKFSLSGGAALNAAIELAQKNP